MLESNWEGNIFELIHERILINLNQTIFSCVSVIFAKCYNSHETLLYLYQTLMIETPCQDTVC